MPVRFLSWSECVVFGDEMARQWMRPQSQHKPAKRKRVRGRMANHNREDDINHKENEPNEEIAQRLGPEEVEDRVVECELHTQVDQLQISDRLNRSTVTQLPQ